MTELDRRGKDWDAAELDAIIVDYFAMLRDELAHRAYVKAHHRAALRQGLQRSEASVEFKHRNISAVLQDLGLPWIWGYKPADRYQDDLFDVVERYLSVHRDLLELQPHAPPATAMSVDNVFIAMPIAPPKPMRPGMERLIRKFDPVARDFRNRQLGRAGEEFVVNIERQRLIAQGRSDLADDVRWVSDLDGDGAGFDILSFDHRGEERLIEVKTTNGAGRTPFFMTRNERAVATERPEHWHLYRVHLFAQQPKIFTVRPPLENMLTLDPETWRATPANLST